VINSIENSAIGEANKDQAVRVLTPEDRVRIALIHKGMKMADLADVTDLSVQYIRQVVRGNFVMWPARRKIEAALGEKFWLEEGA
jgi:hypothetical protein